MSFQYFRYKNLNVSFVRNHKKLVTFYCMYITLKKKYEKNSRMVSFAQYKYYC